MKAIALLLFAAFLAAPAAAQRNVAQELVYQNLTTLVTFATSVNLVGPLSTTQGITVFAPTNDAFSALPAATVAALQNNSALLTAALTYHALPRVLLPQEFPSDGLLPTLNAAAKLRANSYGSIKLVNGVVVGQPINCTNGVVYIVTSVLLSPADSTLNLLRSAANVTNTLVTAVGAAGLLDAFNGNENNSLTLFAPNDAAFAALPASLVSLLLAPANVDILTTILLHHVLPGRFFPPAFNGVAANYTTLAGTTLSIGITNGKLFFGNNIESTAAYYFGTDGVSYSINGVLVPPVNLDYAVRLSNLTTLYAAAKSQGYDVPLRNPAAIRAVALTVFGPTNLAFDSVTPAQNSTIVNNLAGVLGYHVINVSRTLQSFTNDLLLPTIASPNAIRINKYDKPTGTIYTANGVVIANSQSTTTGILHVVNKVLFPPTVRFNDTVFSDPRLTTFRAAAIAANVFPALAQFQVAGLTVFAPTNDAFNALPAGALAGLLNNTAQLFNVLANHVILSTVYSAGLYNGQQLTNAIQVNLTVAIGATVTVGGATVVEADLNHVEGVIHIIDKVILPPAPPATTGVPVATTGAPTGAAATTGSPTRPATTGVPVTGANSDASRIVAGLFALCLILFAL